MAIQRSEYAKNLFIKIDNLFTIEIGPIAFILCEEARDEWFAELQEQSLRITLSQMHLYVSKLAIHIDNPKNKSRFLSAVYSIDALKPYQPK